MTLADSCAGLSTNATRCVFVLQNPWPVLLVLGLIIGAVCWFCLH